MEFQFITEDNGLCENEAIVESYGSVQGVLETSPYGGENMFVIKEALSGVSVQCFLRDDLVHSANEAIGRDVNVFGEKLSSTDGKRKAIKGWKMRVLPRQEDLPSVKDMIGISPDMTGGLPSEVYVKRRFYGEGCAP